MIENLEVQNIFPPKFKLKDWQRDTQVRYTSNLEKN